MDTIGDKPLTIHSGHNGPEGTAGTMTEAVCRGCLHPARG